MVVSKTKIVNKAVFLNKQKKTSAQTYAYISHRSIPKNNHAVPMQHEKQQYTTSR